MTPLQSFTTDHRHLLSAAAAAAGFENPVAFDADDFECHLLSNARRGKFVPLDGVLIRDWDRDYKKTWPGMNVGLRLYHLRGRTFVRAHTAWAADQSACGGYDFLVCDAADYRPLYKLARALKKKSKPAVPPPVMPPEIERKLWLNSIGYLEPDTLAKVKQLGGRAKRGILLTGPPGNGKTSACRWLYAECVRRGWEYKLVSADDYQAARRDDNPSEAVKRLFKLSKPGVVFFDDLDIALRDRDTVKETDDQTVFLTALDGIEGTEGVVYVFTTNCSIELIDPAFRRPGRIDLTLHFPKPDCELRAAFVARWDAEIRAAIDAERVVEDTDGRSFAEIDELRNLLIVHFLDAREWDWDWAKRTFRENRAELSTVRGSRPVGFAAVVAGKM